MEIKLCSGCGFGDRFDALLVLVRASVPFLTDDVLIDAVTSVCPLCDGVQVC